MQKAGCHSFSHQKTLTTDYPKFCIGMPVVLMNSRAHSHVIAKFSQIGSLPHFLTHGAPLHALRAGELCYKHANEGQHQKNYIIVCLMQ